MYICKNNKIMAHIIKDTPVLRGTDAENFVKNLYSKKRINKKRMERMQKNYDYLCSIATFKI